MTHPRATVVVFSHWHWDTHFWQFNIQLGEALAALGHRVIWVDDRLLISRDGLRQWLGGFPFGRATTTRAMRRLQPWSLPNMRLRRNPLPAMLTARDIQRVLGDRREFTVALVYTPAENAIVRRVKPDRLIYWTGDEVTLPHEDWLFAHADAILALSAPTFENAERRSPGKVHRAPTGVPFEMFVEGADSGACPVELASLRRPIFGFAGNLTASRVDFRLVKQTAIAHPQATVLLIGPRDANFPPPSDLPANVVLMDARPYGQMPTYLAQFDVGLVPYLRNAFNLGSSPLKIHEYLAVGLPVVGTGISALSEYGDLAVIENDPEAFANAVGQAALGRWTPELIERRRAAAKTNSVARIATTVSSVIESLR